MDMFEVQKFLSSLTPISHLQYQIWDIKGKMLYPAAEEIPHNPRFAKGLQKMAGIVIEQNRFRHGYLANKYFVCGVPLSNGQSTVGSLVAYYADSSIQKLDITEKAGSGQYALNMENFLSSLAAFVQTNWEAQEEINELAEELEQSFEDLYLYGKIASQIKALKFSNKMLKGLITNLLNNLRADAAFAILPDTQEFDTLVTQPYLENQLKKDLSFYRRLVGHIPSDASSLSEKFFIVNDSSSHPEYKKLWPETYRFLCVKVEHEDGFFGWLGLVSFNMNEIFRQGELKLMVSLAEQLSVVIANTGLYQDLEHFIINMVKSLVFAIEAKDLYTRGHSERVSKLSIRLGKGLGLRGVAIEDLRWASILHDIGKIGIPESILNSTEKLSDEEYDTIKEHPAKGFEILQPVSQLESSLPGVLHHHERFDGNGYPMGLKGEEIPLNARIIAVADTFDAISSSRAYRSAKSYNKALSIVKDVAGTQLDPNIVAILETVAREDGYLAIGDRS